MTRQSGYECLVSGAAVPDHRVVIGAILDQMTHVVGADREKVFAGVTALALLAGIGSSIYLAAKARWLWAAIDFFLITPIGAVVVGFIAAALTPPPPVRRGPSVI